MPMSVESEFSDTVIGIPEYRTENVMPPPPDGGNRLELELRPAAPHRDPAPRWATN